MISPQILQFDKFSDSRGDINRIWLDSQYMAARKEYTPASRRWPHLKDWCQENVAITNKNVLRGIHGNQDDNNWTLFTLLYGKIYLVWVNCIELNGFGGWKSTRLVTANGGMQVLVPPGWGRAYYVESEVAVVHYRWTTPYEQQKQFTYRYDDYRFGILWPFKDPPILSERDTV